MQILAVKQAAATRARAAAASAADNLDTFLRAARGEAAWARPPKKARHGLAPALL